MSRTCIDRNPEMLNMVKGWSLIMPAISFKKYGVSQLHFGNAIDCDYLKGQNLNVVSTHSIRACEIVDGI